MTIEFNAAQHDMRSGYFGGAPGMLVSGLVWLLAGLVGLVVSQKASVFTLFIGGMAIHPVGSLLAKWLGRRGKHMPGNPLLPLALETTILLFIGLFLAFAMLQINSQYFYPVMLLIIGGRYLMFSSLYGMRMYWVIGGLLAISGAACFVLQVAFLVGAFVGGVIEVLGAAVIFNLARREAPL
ncbi:hypothetical protein GCM10008090_31820 [Arenicella chitinivorans]|uniref:Uncharacterized protein n=1 Tax=Arenicella chitinivorans TaxID=1329800 RepID=A0A918S0S3_9GAMM|nr:hypothetical protein [Arenicella chitinivorans]GHA19748.1 hypothetical protein GCM10008090_31820 [Arenicella chitinivorans]